MAWGPKSGRSAPLPSNWRFLRAQRLKIDGYQCTETREDTQLRCESKATDVDHIGEPDDHRLIMLRSLCGWHHDIKTAGQGGRAAGANKKARTSREPHPGYLPIED